MSGAVFRGNATATNSSSASSLSPALPALDINANGLLIAVVLSKNNATHSCGTAGWSLISQQNSGASFTASLWCASQVSAAPAFTWSGAAACQALILYYTDPADPINVGVGASSVTTGSTSTHTTASITTTRDKSIVALIDVSAANTLLGGNSGWTTGYNAGSSTSATVITEQSKSVATSGTATGATSTGGANAAWVAWQIEIMESLPDAGFESSKIEADPWYAPPDGFDTSKL